MTERAWLLLYCLADSKKPEVWHSAESHSYQDRRNWQRSAFPAGGLADDGRHLQVCLAAQTQYKLLQKHKSKTSWKNWPCQIFEMGIQSLLALLATAVSLLLNETCSLCPGCCVRRILPLSLDQLNLTAAEPDNFVIHNRRYFIFTLFPTTAYELVITEKTTLFV